MTNRPSITVKLDLCVIDGIENGLSDAEIIDRALGYAAGKYPHIPGPTVRELTIKALTQVRESTVSR